MELWIRNQDKTALSKISQIAMENENIIGYNGYCVKLGKYVSKERQLQILDEIQDEIENYVGTMAQIVYQMPEE